MLRHLISYIGMVLIASLTWYFIHELFGGEKACFDSLAPNDSPLGCSTGLQLFVQVVIAFWVSLVVLLTPLLITKMLRKSQQAGIKASVVLWCIVSVTLGIWHMLSVYEEYGLLRGFQMGVGEITVPYILTVIFYWFAESKFKNVTNVSN